MNTPTRTAEKPTSVESGLDDRRLPLAKADWLAAGLRVLADEGIESVQIARLARDLNVTRGSFYWHFSDHNDLLDAIVGEWRRRNSGVMLEALEGSTSLTHGILSLFQVWVDKAPFDPCLDHAMRDWARRSPEIRETVEAEDDSRVEAIARFFRANGYEKTEAFIRARVIYFTQVSYDSMGIEEPMTKRMSYLNAYFRCFTGMEIDEDTARAYRKAFARRKTTP